MLALHLSADLNLFASPLYIAMIAGLTLLLGVNIARADAQARCAARAAVRA